MFVCRVMLLAALCLVVMVENQTSQHISRMRQLRHTKAITSH